MNQGYKKALAIGWTALCSVAMLYVYLHPNEYYETANASQKAELNLVLIIVSFVVWQTPFILVWTYRRLNEWFETKE